MLHRIFTYIIVFLTAFIVFNPANVWAQLQVDITKGNLDPTPIAIPDFITTDARVSQIGKDLADVVRADLERSGLFNALDPASFIERQSDINYQPTFADWRVIKAEALVSGRIVTVSYTHLTLPTIYSV